MYRQFQQGPISEGGHSALAHFSVALNDIFALAAMLSVLSHGADVGPNACARARAESVKRNLAHHFKVDQSVDLAVEACQACVGVWVLKGASLSCCLMPDAGRDQERLRGL